MRGIGTDIVEIERVKNALTESFLRKVLSPQEIEICNAYRKERQVEFVAGRFAAKEAIIKCLADIETPAMRDLNITNNVFGKPEIIYKDYQIFLSISHEKSYAIAMAVLE